jgi:branched-chain amino acid transport system substrate-binding protein
MLGNGVGSPLLSGKDCTPNETHWVFDTAMLAKTLGTALYKEGGDTWFYIRSDYVFGKALRDDSAAAITALGGKVVGEVAVPLGTSDFSSALLTAQASGAKVVALGMAGGDLLNCLKQAAEFGLAHSGQRVVALIVFINDIKSLGLATTQGTLACETFYWDLNDHTRAFTKRIIDKTAGVPPNMSQAGSYSATRHYLKAVAAMGAANAKRSGREVVAKMKTIPVQDDVLVNASIRQDGRVVSDAYVFEAKTPAESTGPWDIYKLRATLGPDEAWRSMADGACPLVKS